MISKEEVLLNAPRYLNKPDQPWEITVQGDTIIGYWKWMDSTFFSANSIEREIQEYKFVVTLLDNGKWVERNIVLEEKGGVGTTGISAEKRVSSLSAYTSKSFSFRFGKDNETGKVGVIKNTFDTSTIKKPIREFLTNCGWKKKGLFG